MKRFFITSLFALLMLTVHSQDVALKALFVDEFEDIVFVKAAEERLLSFAQENGFNYLILSNIKNVHQQRFPIDNAMTDDAFEAFIIKAKTKYGIQHISVAAQEEADFLPVFKYNKHHSEQKEALIDGVFLDFSFWTQKLTRAEADYCTTYLEPNGFPCTRIGGFYFFRMQLRKLKAKTNENNMKLETMVAIVSREEMQTIAQMVDIIHLQYFREDTKKIGKYKTNRIDVIIDGHSKAQVFPMFSANENHMKAYLAAHQKQEVYGIWKQQIEAEKSLAPIMKNVSGYSWANYSDF